MLHRVTRHRSHRHGRAGLPQAWAFVAALVVVLTVVPSSIGAAAAPSAPSAPGITVET